MRRIGMLDFPEPVISGKRKILHVDMDAFYASIEQRDNPAYRHRPIIIAKHPQLTGGKGVVATASYEARQYGVHSAMSAKEAYERCPQGIFVPARHPYYKSVSQEVRQVFRELTPIIEPVSIDEAYLDVTHNKLGLASAYQIAQLLQFNIYEKVQLTASIGVSYNKFLAKCASDLNKPAGIASIPPEEAVAFLSQLPVQDIYGIGRETVKHLHERDIYTGKDLQALSQEECLKLFGKAGLGIYERLRGVDNRPVQVSRTVKSVSRERTFFPFLTDEQDIVLMLRRLAKGVRERAQAKQVDGYGLALKLRYADFTTLTRQIQSPVALTSWEKIYELAWELWELVGERERGVRLLGLALLDLNPTYLENMRLNFDT